MNIDDYSRTEVPANKTRNWFAIGLIITGVTIAVPAFILGGALGNGLGLTNTIIAVYAGSLILTIFALLTGIVGAKRKVSTYIILKNSFGEYGSNLVIAIIAVTVFAWFGINTEIFANSARELLQTVNITASTQALAIVGGLLMMTTAIIGFRALSKLSVISVPLLLILLIVAISNVLKIQPLGVMLEQSSNIEAALPLGVAISIVAGAFMVGAVVIPDLTRYAKSAAQSIGAIIFGFLISFPIILILSAILSIGTGESELAAIFTAAGVGVFSFIIFILASWTTNDNNLYSASLGLSAIFKDVAKWKLATIAGILGTVLAVFGILSQFIPLLLLIGILIPPVAGVYIVHHFVFKDFNVSGKIGWAAIFTWIIASGFGYATTPVVEGQVSGLGLLTFTTIPALDSIIVSLVLYYILGKIFFKNNWRI